MSDFQSDDSFTELANDKDRVARGTMLSTCPDCGEEYPLFSSPPGQLGTLCEECGYTSPDYLPPGHPGRQPTRTELRGRLDHG